LKTANIKRFEAVKRAEAQDAINELIAALAEAKRLRMHDTPDAKRLRDQRFYTALDTIRAYVGELLTAEKN